MSENTFTPVATTTTENVNDVVKIEQVVIKQKRPSIMDIIREKQADQDFQQKMNVASTLLLEIYRVLMGAFLVVFIPQACGEEICTMTQNINRDDALSRAAIICNVATMLSFLFLYFIEVKRENKLINYLEVNRFTPVDNESVGEALVKLPTNKKNKILDYDRYYKNAGYVSTGSFIINAVLSSIVVYSHYLDSKTVTVYITNLLFMSLKVADVFSTVNTKQNVFYSAYLKNKVQFNDVDPDKVIVDDEALIEDVAVESDKEEDSVSNVDDSNV